MNYLINLNQKKTPGFINNYLNNSIFSFANLYPTFILEKFVEYTFLRNFE